MGIWASLAKAGGKIAAKVGWKGGFFLGTGAVAGSAAANAGSGGGSSGGFLPGWIFDPLGLGDIGRAITIGVVAVIGAYALLAYAGSKRRRR